MSCTMRWRTTSPLVRCTQPSPSMSPRIRSRPPRPLRPPATSTWVVSPVTTALDPKPMRVRNIFICSGVVFCASSRMMKLELSVRPRMNASGATSTAPRSSSLPAFSVPDHVVQGVPQRAQVGVDLRHEVAGQEAEPLPGLDRRAGEDDAVDLLGLQRLHGHGHGQPALAGAGRPDPEGDDVLADGVDVALLAARLRAARDGRARAQHLGAQHLRRTLVGRTMSTLRRTVPASRRWPCSTSTTRSSRRRATRSTSSSPSRAISLPRTWIADRREGGLDGAQHLVSLARGGGASGGCWGRRS